ncbi:MAG: hypothetical protein J6035_04185 [Bacteroidaceae bacterium]|nr:hypothetical protein [Bacteroidaceae bacterium]
MPRSINVAGVNVTLNPDAKESAGASAIGEKLKTEEWDIVAASEDFNYHSDLWNAAWNDGVNGGGLYSYNSTTHRGNISVNAQALARFARQQSPVFDIDGLCLFFRWNRVTPSNESWTSWNTHYGYTDDGADGMIDKGYRYYLVTLATGEEIDVYILHMDAETSAGDNAARDSQLKQLADAILSTHNGRPIVVLGDTNCRYTRDKVEENFMNRIEADERFTVHDPYVDIVMKGVCPSVGANSIMDQGSIAANRALHGYDYGEVVDKVFYINTTESGKRISAKSYKMEYSFKNDQGEPLADHWPIVVKMDIHDYDPAIDDKETTGGGLSGEYYIRNAYSKQYIKQGGWYDTQAVLGTYGSLMKLTRVSGKYLIQSPIGYLTQGDNYMDGSSQKMWSVALTSDRKTYNIKYGSGSSTKYLSGSTGKDYPYGSNKCALREMTTGSGSLQRWELVTKEQIMTEMMDNATETTPFECTFLLSGANFDRYDNTVEEWKGWPDTATKMTCNRSGGVTDIANGNPCAEVYCESYSGWTSYGTTWELAQTLSGLPDGRYKATMQGFYRDGEINKNNPGAQHARFYLRSGGAEEQTFLKSMYEAHCTKAPDETVENKDKDGYYIPNSMEDASYFFNAGYYENELTIMVNDGNLTIAVGKPVTTKTTSGWTCFDNFRLFYLGHPDYPDGVDVINADAEQKKYSERKVFEDGRIVILKDGERYNTAGQQIR